MNSYPLCQSNNSSFIHFWSSLALIDVYLFTFIATSSNYSNPLFAHSSLK